LRGPLRGGEGEGEKGRRQERGKERAGKGGRGEEGKGTEGRGGNRGTSATSNFFKTLVSTLYTCK